MRRILALLMLEFAAAELLHTRRSLTKDELTDKSKVAFVLKSVMDAPGPQKKKMAAIQKYFDTWERQFPQDYEDVLKLASEKHNLDTYPPELRAYLSRKSKLHHKDVKSEFSIAHLAGLDSVQEVMNDVNLIEVVAKIAYKQAHSEETKKSAITEYFKLLQDKKTSQVYGEAIDRVVRWATASAQFSLPDNMRRFFEEFLDDRLKEHIEKLVDNGTEFKILSATKQNDRMRYEVEFDGCSYTYNFKQLKRIATRMNGLNGFPSDLDFGTNNLLTWMNQLSRQHKVDLGKSLHPTM